MKIKALKIVQNETVFFLLTMDSSLLGKICSTTMESIKKSDDIYQRKLNDNRVARIAEFAQRSRAVFPTCVVLNSRTFLTYDEETMELDVPEEKNSFFIIDGQHRIAGIGKSNKNYQLGVVILNKISIDVQSELFITINSEQKVVNPNVRFNMRSNDKFYTPEKMVRNIAEMFNTDAESPFFNKIWMDDTSRKRGEFPLSLSAFCEPICAYIYNSKDYYALKDALYKSEGKMEALGDYSAKYGNNILWPLYISENEVVLYKILFNYFEAVHDIYEYVWKDPKSVIIRTTGYNAFIILFKSVFKYCKSDGNNFSYTRMLQILSANRIKDDCFYVPNVGVGRSGAYELYRMLLPEGFNEEQIDSEYMDSLSEDVEEYFV